MQEDKESTPPFSGYEYEDLRLNGADDTNDDLEPSSSSPKIILPPLPEPRPKLDKFYRGKHSFGVNRVNDGRRAGIARVEKQEESLWLSAEMKKGPYSIALEGTVHPVNRREFILEGTLSGKPDLSFKQDTIDHKETKARFLFRATGKRQFWRLYEVNGVDCVCWDHCGNDFCYIDIGFSAPK